ncbi:MAG: ATP-dependent RNA helicase HrpA [Acidimicrobiales bacterium]
MSDAASNDAIHYPPELPVSQRREELLEVIRDHQVVIVAGETGSGKSTQLPKLCLELGRGRDGWIGHTQPRRLAARSIAERVADELEEEVGGRVGYAVRFTDKVSARTEVKLMTDGILLAEIQRDRDLRRYDTLIIDEAHERSLNIDFLLGYLAQLLPRRPDLKVIVTSATIDTQRFSEHFGDAPIVEVTGRTYPVEVRYRDPADPESPLAGADDGPLDQPDAIAAAVRELWFETDGDILVFCSGEREIRDAQAAVEDLGFAGLETLPLFARLSAAEQHRVFARHSKRRVVIATNVAETSLTVPGIRSVIDTGLARISRYSVRSKVQRLPIEAISQASADQRAGRCGRLGPGVCIRLYAEHDYDGRPEFTEPEILRTNLASVILQMAAIGLGDIEAFPFVEPPDRRSIRDGVAVLEELDAVDPDEEGTRRWLTPLGRRLARIPLDPRLGAMVLEADERDCVHDVIVIAAALSIQDPRERPDDAREQANEAHRRFTESGSDFLAWLDLWNHVRGLQRELSGNAFRRRCRAEFLHHQRLREWMDLERQLRRVVKDLGIRVGRGEVGSSHPDDVHRALLVGLLSQIGRRADDDKRARNAKNQGGRRRNGPPPRPEFTGARATQFALAPGTALGRGGAPWVMVAELVETNRLWGRTAAAIDPAWIEDAADHLVVRSYESPRWAPERGTAVVTERVKLWGLPVVAGRTINLSRVNPGMARELFIHHGLVEPEWPDGHEFPKRRFFVANQAIRDDVVDDLTRRRRVDHEALQERLRAFYDARVGANVTSVGHFNRWWKQADDAEALRLGADDLVEAEVVDADAFPAIWEPEGYALDYTFDPSSPLDGIVVTVPLLDLAALDQAPFTWLVPGLRTELVTELLRSLPKALRRPMVPLPDTAAGLAAELDNGEGSHGEGRREQGRAADRPTIAAAVAELVRRRHGLTVHADSFDLAALPTHLRPVFRIVDGTGATLAAGPDLERLRARLAPEVAASLRGAFADEEVVGLADWPAEAFGSGDLPEQVERIGLVGYPTLAPGSSDTDVDLRVLADPDEAAEAHWQGVARLVRGRMRQPARTLDRHLAQHTKLHLAAAPVQPKAEWYRDAIEAVADELVARAGGPPRRHDAFEELARSARDQAGPMLGEIAARIDALVDDLVVVGRQLDDDRHLAARTDARRHLERLVAPGVLARVGWDRLDDLARHLRGLRVRLDQLEVDPARDAERLSEVAALEAEVAPSLGRLEPDDAEAVRWMLEDYRTAQLAPTVGAGTKVSAKRIRRAVARGVA